METKSSKEGNVTVREQYRTEKGMEEIKTRAF